MERLLPSTFTVIKIASIALSLTSKLITPSILQLADCLGTKSSRALVIVLSACGMLTILGHV